MSKFMTIAGIILAAVAVALGLMIFFSPSSVVGWGITPQAAIELLVGGILAIGLGGVIDAAGRAGGLAAAVVTASVPAAEDLPQFGRRAETAAAPVVTAAAAEEGLSPATSQTIKAIEEAKSEISKAFGDGESETKEASPAAAAEPAVTVTETAEMEAATPAEEETEASAEDEDGQLYVIEEKVMRGRPARLLSDGTIEAETDEGWMRFENLDHLNEYLDAMAPGG